MRSMSATEPVRSTEPRQPPKLNGSPIFQIMMRLYLVPGTGSLKQHTLNLSTACGRGVRVTDKPPTLASFSNASTS